MTALDALLSQLIPDAEALGIDVRNLKPEDLIAHLDAETIEQLLAPILAEEERAKFNRFDDLFPNEGPFRRELYEKHLEFFRAGKDYRERCFMAANRVGKTVAGGYEVTAHLTGQYPHWWEGRVFDKRVRAWVAGDTNETTRDILQLELLGQVCEGEGGRKTVDGSGLIPRECLGVPKWKTGVVDLVDTIPILHSTGEWSQLAFKSFDQGRKKFQGTAKEVIWLDEECPADVYGESLIRVTTTRGIILTTFTPLNGLTETALQFLPKEMRPAETEDDDVYDYEDGY